MRDEIRAVVRVAVEQALAPVVARQRELEQRIDREEAKRRELEQRIDREEADRREADQQAELLRVTKRSAPPPANVIAPAPKAIEAPAAPPIAPPLRFDTMPDIADVPWEIDGGRRQRLVSWIIGLLVVAGLAAALAGATLSQMGYH
jgi:hypothetical protein